MNTPRLALKNLLYFCWANLAVIAGVAVATAVLTGAMLVGDSVRQSLRHLADQRLGQADYALVSTQFFPQSLAERLSNSPGYGDDFDPAVAGVVLQGGALR